VQKLFSTSINNTPPAFKNAVRYFNSETNSISSDHRPISTKFGVVRSMHPWERFVKSAPPLEIALKNMLNRQ